MTTMKQKTTKIWEKTLKKLRMIYALTGERMTEIIDRLATQELERLKSKDKEE